MIWNQLEFSCKESYQKESLEEYYSVLSRVITYILRDMLRNHREHFPFRHRDEREMRVVMHDLIKDTPNREDPKFPKFV